MDNSYTMLGAEFSLYSGKVRAYLRYKAIPFEEVTATSAVYRDIIVPKTGVRYMPVVLTPEHQAVQDTTDIIDFLEPRFPKAPIYPTTPCQRLCALLFELYGDEWLLVPAMHYRWAYNRDFVVQEFAGLQTDYDDPAQRLAAAQKAIDYFSGSLPYLGVTDQTKKLVENSYEGFLSEFDRHLADHPFLLGSRPSIGDFGLIGPLYAHLYRDPYSGNLMRRVAPRVADWVQRMIDPKPLQGEFLADDEVPETLQPLLQRLFSEYLPILKDTVGRLEQWLAANSDSEIPRVIGQHEFELAGVREKRCIYPYAQWMLQRVLDHYQQAEPDAQASMNSWLNSMSLNDLLSITVRSRVERENNKLVRGRGTHER